MSENIERTLGRLEAKVDSLLEAQSFAAASTTKLDGRVASLEKWQSRVIGAYAALVLIVGAALKFWR